MVFTNVDIAVTLKAMAKDNNTTIPSLVTEIVAWAFSQDDFNVSDLSCNAAKKRGRQADISKVDLGKFTPEQLEALQSRIAAMTTKD
jgi:hypothetical protein